MTYWKIWIEQTKHCRNLEFKLELLSEANYDALELYLTSLRDHSKFDYFEEEAKSMQC